MRAVDAWLLTCMAVLAVAGPPRTAQAQSAPPGELPVSYTTHVAPIVARRCGACHVAGGDAPFSLSTVDEVRRRASTMVAVTKSRFMPPWKPDAGFGEFAGDRRMTDAEIRTLASWVDSGMLEGPPASTGSGGVRDVPGASVSGWGARPPDLIVRLPAYTLPPGGADVFRNFVVEVPGADKRLVRGLQFRPGNSAVHHANIRVDPTNASRLLEHSDPLPGYEGLIARSAEFPDGHFLGWTPGQSASPVLAEDLAWPLDGGSDLVVQLHLRPSGKVEVIAPVIGLFFGKDAPARTPTAIRLGRQDLEVPGGATRHVVTDTFVLPVDAEVRAVQPHAHYRAISMDAWATLPDGSRRALIRISDWDMNWQDRYVYAEPFWLPSGTRLSLTYTFDNSEGNPRNPDRPPTPATWGWRSSDEMADLWIQVLTRTDADRVRLRREVDRKMQAEDAVGSEVILRREPNHVHLRNDAAALYLALGDPGKALAHFQMVTLLTPEIAAAWFNEGIALEALGQLDEAQVRYARALAIDDSYSAAHNNLSTILLRQGRVAEARAGFERAVRADPRNVEAHLNLAAVLAGTAEPDAALAHVAEVLSQKPDGVTRLTPIAWLLAAHPDPAARRPAEARRLSERILAVTGREAAALDLLAACHAALGQFAQAVQLADEAESATPANLSSLRQAIRERLALYRARQPYTLTLP